MPASKSESAPISSLDPDSVHSTSSNASASSMDIETVLQECNDELDDLTRKYHAVRSENEQYKSINEGLQQALGGICGWI